MVSFLPCRVRSPGGGARTCADSRYQPAVARIARGTGHHRNGMRFGFIDANNSDAGDEHGIVFRNCRSPGNRRSLLHSDDDGKCVHHPDGRRSVDDDVNGRRYRYHVGRNHVRYSPVTKNDNARTGTAALAGTANAGSYCVNVYDSGNVPEESEVSYEVTAGASLRCRRRAEPVRAHE